MMNRYLKSQMALHGDNIESLAKHLNISNQTLGRKISGKSDFTQSEMNKIREKYELDDKSFAQTFTKDVK